MDSLEQYRGFELWRDQVNSAGGIKAGGKSYKIQFVSYDDESNSKRVQQLYSRMILQDNADFLFSPYSSSLTATAAIVTEQYGKIMLTTGAAEGKTYTLGNHYLFQMFAPGAEYLKGVLDMLKTKDPKATIAFVYEDASFSNVRGESGEGLCAADRIQRGVQRGLRSQHHGLQRHHRQGDRVEGYGAAGRRPLCRWLDAGEATLRAQGSVEDDHFVGGARQSADGRNWAMRRRA